MAVLLAAMLGVVAATIALRGGDDEPGADSPTAAVEELLSASVDGDLERARRVTLALPDQELEAELAEIAAFVERAGGLDEVSAHDDASRQMGSHHIVDVLVSDSSRTVTFDVYQNSGKYRVAVGEPEEPEDRPTTDPSPPPSQSPSSERDA